MMKYFLLLGLIFLSYGQTVFAGEELGAPVIDLPAKNIRTPTEFSLPYEKPDPITPTCTPSPTNDPEKMTVTPTIIPVIHESSDPIELKPLPGPINPSIPCELQVPWENGAPLPCKQLPTITPTMVQPHIENELSKPSPQVKDQIIKRDVEASKSATLRPKNPQQLISDKHSLWEAVTIFFKKLFS